MSMNPIGDTTISTNNSCTTNHASLNSGQHCPYCGYCPNCGRPYDTWRQPYWPYYPWRGPYWQVQPNIVYC